ncbi:Wzz/FepE/Etk N-terminal domain-containing protein [Pusillimonas sp. SM2304]|uniref:Wzz/FepE/Etk N-terminal domain-containing protein n=1 Tax=Pusillimonas sp. SM2304 TaxID=3073241 RepID=UPI00287607AE|nr:Wzz/FepE/Etk N-terminal domain-containing protein [Pusillimonas sp. SM2304]MDS1140051.1 Wzz/FepE/Etk N-terminal domain-containing protein [Pusillimonas sp. SM2304]
MQAIQENNKNHQPNSSNEIDLRALTHILWSSKFLISSITLVVTCTAGIYIFLSTPIYQVQVQALPPVQSGLAAYNMANQLSGAAVAASARPKTTERQRHNQYLDSAIESLSPKDAYQVFLRHLSSSSLRQAFFDNIYLVQYGSQVNDIQRQQLWEGFNKALNIERPQKPTDNERMTLTLQGSDPQAIAQRANEFVEMAIKAAQRELLLNLQSVVQLYVDSTQSQIESLREVAVLIHQSELAHLREALQLAESIDLQQPPQGGNLITSYTGSTHYLRGAKTLRSELELMEQRQKHDPYIEELPSVLRTQALLKGIDTRPEVSVATIDQMASIPTTPIKPKKMLVLALGVILGGMLGIFITLIRAQIQRTIRIDS